MLTQLSSNCRLRNSWRAGWRRYRFCIGASRLRSRLVGRYGVGQ
jgi:hypothetical protein